MKILILSRSPWRNDNSFGNTYSNIFDGMNDVEIANVYLANGLPDFRNAVVKKYYQISESDMISSLFKTQHTVGREIPLVNRKETFHDGESDKKMNKITRLKRRSVYYIARELVWKYGKANLDDMMRFVNTFNPDIMFLPFYYAMYVDRIALYILNQISIPLVLEASIDIYSLKQISFDPLYWLNRFLIRRTVRDTVRKAKVLYVISEEMRRDYEQYLKIRCEVLYKFPEQTRMLNEYKINDHKPLTFLFTGNIGSGRWKTLGMLADEIISCNCGKLVIYTPTEISLQMKAALANSELHSAVSSEMVTQLQSEADVLVHVESFSVKSRLQVRYSISTKVMDYISSGRCILAIGPHEIASIKYLELNDLAVVCCNSSAIKDAVLNLKNNPHLIKRYADNNIRYVNTMPTREKAQTELKEQLLKAISEFEMDK